jgi:hypothetical protein
MTEYSRIAKGSFVATGKSAAVILPFVPDYVELWNYTNIKTAGASRVTRAWWDNTLFDGNANPTMVELYNAGSALVDDTVQTNGISTFQAGLMLQYGPVVQHTATTDFVITKSASPTIITVSGAGIPDHGLNTGDVVIFQNLAQTSSTGMQQIAGIPFVVTRISATQFSIPWDTSGSNYTTVDTSSSTNNVGSYKQVLYPDLYFPGDIFISSITLGATTTIETTTQHNYVVGQEVAFRIPSIPGAGSPPVWGTTQLNSLPNVKIPGSPIYAYVIQVIDMTTFVVNINSTSYTAFNVNLPFASYVGEKWPQVVAVGDVNTGGVQISAGSPLYPSPQYSYGSLNSNSTINGPAIQGAFVNNTRQGFIIGSGFLDIANTVQMISADNIIAWRAYLHDYSKP